MAKTIEKLMSEAQADLARRPTLKELAARIAQRRPYTGPAIAPVIRQERDSH